MIKPQFWPSLFTLPALVLLCWLGFWQLDRLEWKLDKIAKLDQRFALPAAELPETIEDAELWEYRHVSASGAFIHDKEMYFFGAGPHGKAGYEIFTPFKTGNGRILIVNRGWIPEHLKDRNSRPETLLQGPLTLVGVVRLSQNKQRFAPENDAKANVWYYANVAMMAKSASFHNIYEILLYADGEQAGAKYPLSGRTQTQLVNNHLAYAFTWFAFAFILLVIYVIFHMRSAKTSGIKKDRL